MTVVPAARDGEHQTDHPPTRAEREALLAVLDQLRQVRDDQREAMVWLAEHADGGAPA